MRPAAHVVRKARTFRARIQLRAGHKVANARDILTLLMLAASFGTPLTIEAAGIDEESAVAAVVSVFEDLEAGSVEVDSSDLP